MNLFKPCMPSACRWIAQWVLVGAVGACAFPSKTPVAPTPPAVAGSAPQALASAPAAKIVPPSEIALSQGIKAYQSGQYASAETQLKSALQLGLSQASDVAMANKHLAFIYCTSKREALCSAAFKAARAADPTFALTKAEAGHPMWGRVYRKAIKAR